MKYIGRKRYFDKILPFVDKALIKVLLGQRRVGKSYVLLQLIDWIKNLHSDANVIYINKEWDGFGKLRNHEDLWNMY